MGPAPILQNPTPPPVAIKYIPVPPHTWLLSMTEESMEVRFLSFGVGHREAVCATSLGAGMLAVLAGTCTIMDWQWEARNVI